MGTPDMRSEPDQVMASDLVARLALAGVKLSAEGANLVAEPRAALTDELRALIQANKRAILEALAPIERGRELRRERALRKLAEEPDKQRVAVFDSDSDQAFVLCTVAIRGVGTCELRIPRDRYDPWLVLEALQRAAQ
jgi:hypothetical protein